MSEQYCLIIYREVPDCFDDDVTMKMLRHHDASSIFHLEEG